MRPIPDKAIRLARLICNAGAYKNVLVSCMPTSDGFYTISVSEVGVGKARSLPLSLAAHSEPYSKGVKLDEHFSELVGLIETYGYDCVKDKQCRPLSTQAMLDALPAVKPELSEEFCLQADHVLLPVLSGVRVFIVIDEGVTLHDARSTLQMHDKLHVNTSEVLWSVFKNGLSGRTVLEAFYVHGEVAVTDVYRLRGHYLCSCSYGSRMAKLKTVLKTALPIPNLTIVEPVANSEYAVRILSSTKSLLKPVLLAKLGMESVLIDKYKSYEVEVSQVKGSECRISCFDGGPLDGRKVKSPVLKMPAFSSTYSLSGVRAGSQRLPVFI